MKRLLLVLLLGLTPEYASAQPTPSEPMLTADVSDTTDVTDVSDAAEIELPAVEVTDKAPDATDATEATDTTDSTEEAEVAPPVVPAAPQTVSEAVDVGKQTVEAAKSGEWLLMASGIIMLIIFLLLKFWKSLPRSWAPWISIAVGVLGTAATAWTSGATLTEGLLQGITYGLGTGLGATGAWEAFGKKVAKRAATPS